MLLLPLVAGPAVMLVASTAERRLGAAVAGWITAIPTTMPIAVMAVGLEMGDEAGSTLALSAATNVAAQVAFGLAFALLLRTKGTLAGLTAGASAFAAAAILLALLPPLAAVALAVPVLVFGARLVGEEPAPTVPAERRPQDTALACAVAALSVGAVLAIARAAGPAAAGAIGAFPALSTALTLVVARASGRRAAAAGLRGLVRGLPCYLAFCVTAAALAPVLGTPAAVAAAVAACIATCTLTWRTLATGQARKLPRAPAGPATAPLSCSAAISASE